eukprot:UN10469
MIDLDEFFGLIRIYTLIYWMYLKQRVKKIIINRFNLIDFIIPLKFATETRMKIIIQVCMKLHIDIHILLPQSQQVNLT